jgi:carboxypeptidase C (cathepsin A)
MRRSCLVAAALTLALALPAIAQRPPAPRPATRDTSAVAETPVPKELSSVTEHTIRIDGQAVPYRATAATMLLSNDKGEPIGNLYYTAYTRTDVKDVSRRPLAFLYNGGPGSASAWLHMGAFGPRRVVTTNAAPTPPPPYQLVDNANSLIDVADLVFIDPIGTGFSRPVGKATGQDFWGVDEDAASLANFITQYVSRNARWNSPKYLIGESYGTTRSAVLVNRLQQREGMDFNGVVLISAVLDFETLLFAPGHDISYVLYLPSYALTAAYHGLIPKPPDVAAFAAEVRAFAMGPYASALAKGSALPATERAVVIKQLAAYTGLSADYLDKANLRVNLGQFRAELQRTKGDVTGRLDARFSGPVSDLLSEAAEYDPQSTAITGAFTAAINGYLRDELKFDTKERYNVSAGRLEWNWRREGSRGWQGATYVGTDLAQALRSNPNLRVQIEDGYYDLATPFFAIEYTVDHLGLPQDQLSHVEEKYYEAGHMMYLLEPALARLKTNIAGLITATSGR